MIDANDIKTVHSIRELFDHVRNHPKHLIFWIGAGASSWCNYPRWPELANLYHSQYVRYERGYDVEDGVALISEKKFPELFQRCKDVNASRFNTVLAETFSPRDPSPVYRRFAAALRDVSPTSVLTTNIDELLEKELPRASTVSRYDLEHAERLLRAAKPFVCKLHGSISDIKSTVFTSSDYSALTNDPTFMTLLERILATSIVIFIGYSLQDDYVLSLLSRNCDIGRLFGDGPHFAILPCEEAALPSSVRVIRYIPEPHRDHRSSITIIEELRSVISQGAKPRPAGDFITGPPREIHSAHLLFDIFPPGTWKTSYTLGITDDSEKEKQLIIGTGFSEKELPHVKSTAMHDVIVGLLCFDRIYTSISSLARVHNLLGSERFWHLVQGDALSFINWTSQEGIIFPSADSISFGDLNSFTHHNPDFTRRTVSQIVREQLNPVPGKEEVAERLFSELYAKIIEINKDKEGNIPNLVRSLLLRPSIQQLLGVSGGTPLTSLTRWNVFPVLRLANVVKIGTACRLLQIGSAKLDFGTARLAGPALAVATGAEWADNTASYVLSGRFDADLGAAVLEEPSLLDLILKFRESEHGEELRREIFGHLSASEGAEVNVAINSCLRSAIPSSTLQRVRDGFVGLLTSQYSALSGTLPAIWNDRRSADDNALAQWKAHSRRVMEEYCRQRKISQYSACPCGSGEKLKFCCGQAVSDAV